ncbi:universal stress protein [Lentiprolixibacter aurantiacus]|uniref:Universal stress protein n=1 Tax=Lentiprolixibacter aurantiacus TaxID=2993939 RepID=A0AAE3SP99_9FLAO|nr:universal stress protein [Lentiprolixibacter aurantiacus]MCX2720612.1 universal stress protein [Lentiprolixibacter aurantiacus]
MSKNILGLIDFSSVTEDIVAKAAELSKVYDAKCWLVHVARPDPEFIGYDVGPKYIRDARAEHLLDEHHKLDEYKSRVISEGVNCEVLLVQGEIMETIHHEVEKLGIDLIVLGSHGRSMLYELMVGSVCENLLKNSKVPLYVLPAKK